jgi:tetratricopeptide (TPR) repeat protein
MTRRVTLVALAVAVLGFARADELNDELTLAQQKELEGKAAALAREGNALYRAGKLPEAAERLEAALGLRRTIYPTAKYPEGHPDLAASLADLALVFDSQGRPTAAEPLAREALAMRRRLYPAGKAKATTRRHRRNAAAYRVGSRGLSGRQERSWPPSARVKLQGRGRPKKPAAGVVADRRRPRPTPAEGGPVFSAGRVEETAGPPGGPDAADTS